jgi:hypothetical protein
MRMADLEETSFLLRLDLGVNGSICEGKALGTFGQRCALSEIFHRVS